MCQTFDMALARLATSLVAMGLSAHRGGGGALPGRLAAVQFFILAVLRQQLHHRHVASSQQNLKLQAS